MAVFEKGFAVTRLAAFLRLTEKISQFIGGHSESILDGFNLAAEPFAEE